VRFGLLQCRLLPDDHNMSDTSEYFWLCSFIIFLGINFLIFRWNYLFLIVAIFIFGGCEIFILN
jgi:hypothetical protein